MKKHEPCTCGHLYDEHDLPDPWLRLEPCELCPCNTYWPESQRDEQDRRLRFIESLKAMNA